MPSLKSLKLRISSVKSTRKITQAMKMVAAAKLRRAEQAVQAARPYSERFAQVIRSLNGALEAGADVPAMFGGTGSDHRHLLVVMTGERGLCGGFNSNIARLARHAIAECEAQGKTVKILTVGRKGRDILNRDYAEYMVDHVDLRDVKYVGFTEAQIISRKITELFEAGEIDVARLFYARYQSVMTQVPTDLQLLPVEAPEEVVDDQAIYEFEPSAEQILEVVLPRYVSGLIFNALLENAASEQGARMTSMDSATRNAGDMIDRLTLEYNRARQAAVTSELIEIISGAEAL